MFNVNKSALTKMQAIIIIGVIVIALVVGGTFYFIFLRPGMPSEIKIGTPTSLTGFLSRYYKARVWLLNKWADEVNAGGNILKCLWAEITS